MVMTNFEARIDKISKNMRANNLDCSSNSTCSPKLNLLSFDILVKSSGVFLQRKQWPTIKRIHWNFCCQTDILIDIFNNYLRLRSTTTPTGKLHGLYQNVFTTWFLKVHLITAISQFNEHIYLNIKLDVLFTVHFYVA